MIFKVKKFLLSMKKFDGTTFRINFMENKSIIFDFSIENIFNLLSFTEESLLENEIILSKKDKYIINTMRKFFDELNDLTYVFENNNIIVYKDLGDYKIKVIFSNKNNGFELVEYINVDKVYGLKIKDVEIYNFLEEKFDKYSFNNSENLKECYYF